MERMRIMCFSYCVSAFMDCTIAACRGIGRSFVPTVIVIMGSCVFRVIWVYTIFAHFHTIPSLYLLYIFSWDDHRSSGDSLFHPLLPPSAHSAASGFLTGMRKPNVYSILPVIRIRRKRRGPRLA